MSVKCQRTHDQYHACASKSRRTHVSDIRQFLKHLCRAVHLLVKHLLADSTKF